MRTEQHRARRLAQSAVLAIAGVLLFFEWPSTDLLHLRVFPALPVFAALGVALTVAGAVVATYVRAPLGGNWSFSATIKRDHELVRSGPYAWVRHPMYFGLLVAAIGTAVALGELRHLLALPFLLLAFRMKQVSEEQLFLQAFGEKYVEYRRSVRQIPAIIDIIVTVHEKVATSLRWNAQRDCQSILAQVTQVIASSRNLRSRKLAKSLRTMVLELRCKTLTAHTTSS